MKCNVGGTDRVIRLAAGAAILAAGYIFHSWWGWVGLVPLLTGLFRFCPAYCALGIGTGGKKDSPKA